MIPPREFIKKISPFSSLSDQELNVALGGLEVDLYPKGETIHRKGQFRKYVYVVFSGLVALFDEETPIDYVSRGELFGVLSVEGGQYLFTARAAEDAICYLLPADGFRTVFEGNEKFSSFFLSLVSRKFRSFRTVAQNRNMFEEAALVTPVEDIICRDPVVCGPQASVQATVALMDAAHVSSVIIVSEEMMPLGILTHRDLRRIIIQRGSGAGVVSFASSPVVGVSAGTTVFDTLAKMINAGINHIVVTERDRILGVVTRRDIEIRLEPSASVFSLYGRILKAKTIGEVEVLFGNMNMAIANVALTQPSFYTLTRLITVIHDAVTAKVINMAKGGSPEGEFLWFSMGSSGRKEQIMASDQDNALVYRSGHPRGFTSAAVEMLDRIGMPRCSMEYTASNPMWNQPLEVWKSYFESWFKEPSPEHVRYLSIFLDMRPVFGDMDIYGEIIDCVRSNVTEDAVRLLADDAVRIQPPLGIFGIIGLHRGVDLKTYGIYPLVNGVRVLAVENGMVGLTSTRERLEALGSAAIIESTMHHDLLEAFGFMQDLRLRHQARALLDGTKVDNTIRWKDLPKVELLLLKESFKVVIAFQRHLMKTYGVVRPGAYGI